MPVLEMVFLENRKLCREREPLDSVETAALQCSYMIYQT